MKVIQAQDKLILKAVSPDGTVTSGDLLTAFAENGGSTGVRISNLEVETQTTLNSTTTTLEDPFLEVNRNNSTADGEDGGLFINRGSENHALLYWDASDDNFVVGTTTHEATVTAISNVTLGQLKVATTPTDANHAASKSYVDSRIIIVSGDDSTAITIDEGATLAIKGGNSVTTDTTAGGDTITINVDAAMTGVNSITSASGENITLTAQTNIIEIDDVITFNSQLGTAPNATGIVQMFAQSPGLSGTGLFVRHNDVNSGEVTELLGSASANLKVFGDDSTTMEVNIPEDEFHIKGGNGITTSTSSTQTLTISLDSQLLTVNELSSTDSTGITIKDDLLLAGTLRAEDSTTISVDGGMAISGAVASGSITSSGTLTSAAVVTETISSADSTSVFFNDGITLAGPIKSDDSGTINIDDALDVEGAITSGAITSGAITSSGVVIATGFTIGSAVIDETDLEQLDGITAGTVAASKAVVADANKDITGFRNVTATGSFIIGSADMNEVDLEKLDGITNGQGQAQKALVLDGSSNIVSGLANVTLSGTLHTTILDVREINSTDSTAVVINEALEVAGALTSGAITSSGVVTGTGFTIGSAVINETDLEKIDGITNGAGAANKALVLDSSSNVASGLAALTASGVVTAAGFTIGSAVIDETDLEKLDGITNGAGAANKALVLDGSANVASGLAALTASGVVTAAGFTIGSAAINEAELETIDGITAGTVIASKAIVTDADKDIAGGRNITISGELDAATLDISGATTIDGLTTLAGSFKQAVHTFVATDAITEAEHAGRILLLGEVGGNAAVTLTLPDATGSGNVYEFFVTVQNTSNYVIKVPDGDNTISGQIMYLDEDGTAVSSFPTVSASDTITINGGTTGGLIGDTIKLVDIAADKFAVQGQMRVAAGANPSTPFSATVS